MLESCKDDSTVTIRDAMRGDVQQIRRLVHYYAERDIILDRDEQDILASLNTFLVAEYDNEILGIISFYDYGEKLKEIRSLAVDDNWKKSGIGSALLKNLIAMLRKKFPESKIFVLTFSPLFFKKYGFTIIDKDTLPEKIWKDCQNCKHKDNCGETALILPQ
jgi:amino-acid N-acetyltransferase